jgi:hypothetical protein
MPCVLDEQGGKHRLFTASPTSHRPGNPGQCVISLTFRKYRVNCPRFNVTGLLVSRITH